jgi:nuclear pore complex protein Nup155
LVDRDGQCPEYSGEEQAICAVGLARAKPGVFIEAIQHIIVLATPVEVRGASKRAV